MNEERGTKNGPQSLLEGALGVFFITGSGKGPANRSIQETRAADNEQTNESVDNTVLAEYGD